MFVKRALRSLIPVLGVTILTAFILNESWMRAHVADEQQLELARIATTIHSAASAYDDGIRVLDALLEGGAPEEIFAGRWGGQPDSPGGGIPRGRQNDGPA
jgi:hypothetical protein